MSKVKGSCLCGNVSYVSVDEPLAVLSCHCLDCQKTSGSAFSVNIAVLEDSLSVEGDSLATYNGQGTEKGVSRHFCKECGSPIYSTAEMSPGMAVVKAGTLDDTSWVQPGINLWCKTKQPWVELDPNLVNAEQNMSAE